MRRIRVLSVVVTIRVSVVQFRPSQQWKRSSNVAEAFLHYGQRIARWTSR